MNLRRRSRLVLQRIGTIVAAAGLAAGSLVIAAPASSADVVRCVGAVDTPGAFVCYTSPRFDHLGFERENVADFPKICYGYGCTADQMNVWLPGEEYGGHFISVLYLGHTYTIYRPTSGQPYVLATTNWRFDPLYEAQVLALSALLTD